MISTPTTGTGQVINYSNRFTISGMEGTWPGGTNGVFETGWKAVSSSPSDVPPTTNTVGDAVVDDVGEGNFAIPYAQQMGDIKYAPMVPPPHSVITATSLAPLYAPSAWVLASEFLPTPTVTTTTTAAATFSTAQRENTVRQCEPLILLHGYPTDKLGRVHQLRCLSTTCKSFWPDGGTRSTERMASAEITGMCCIGKASGRF